MDPNDCCMRGCVTFLPPCCHSRESMSYTDPGPTEAQVLLQGKPRKPAHMYTDEITLVSIQERRSEDITYIWHYVTLWGKL